MNDMAYNERQAVKEKSRFVYIDDERSTRTGGHLWTERIVETQDGLLRRVLKEDGRPLSPRETEAQDARLASLAAHPGELRRLNQDRREDEGRIRDLLQMLTQAFVFEDLGLQNGCERISFEPDPKYRPSSLEERIIHAMAGTVFVDSREKRLCGIDAHIKYEVDFAFGLLGKVDPNGTISFKREEVTPGNWKTTHLSVHIGGKMLLLKSISRDQDSFHHDFHEIPELPLAEANELSRTGWKDERQAAH